VQAALEACALGQGVARAVPVPVEAFYYVGEVQPVLHYTMGGLHVEPSGQVQSVSGRKIDGLFAAGEIMGGVHGENRLGGSSLLDCVVFGREAARSAQRHVSSFAARPVRVAATLGGSAPAVDNEVIPGAAASLVVTVAGRKLDISGFKHPGGALAVQAGDDLTARFHEAHGEDWALLDRPDLKRLDTPVAADPAAGQDKDVPSYVNYGGTWGAWREYVGRRSWFLFHSMAAKYPDHPSEDDQQAMRNLVASLGQLYPCKLCRLHLREQLREPELLPATFASRTEATTWWCKLHNVVNRDLGKEEFDCTPFHLDLVYLKVFSVRPECIELCVCRTAASATRAKSPRRRPRMGCRRAHARGHGMRSCMRATSECSPASRPPRSAAQPTTRVRCCRPCRRSMTSSAYLARRS
jgi:hypothetical protein